MTAIIETKQGRISLSRSGEWEGDAELSARVNQRLGTDTIPASLQMSAYVKIVAKMIGGKVTEMDFVDSEEGPGIDIDDSNLGEKVFCPTGPGGGVDPTCSPGKSGGWTAASIATAKPGELVGGGPGMPIDLAGLKTKGPKKQYVAAGLELAETLAKKGDWAGVLEVADHLHQLDDGFAVSGALAMKKLATHIAKEKPEGTKPANVQGAVDISTWNKLFDGDETQNPDTEGAPSFYQAYGENGPSFYVKTYKDGDQARASVMTAKLLYAAGANVSKQTLVVNPESDKLGVASEFVQGQKQVYGEMSVNDKEMMSRDFLLHAWVGNWQAGDSGNYVMSAKGPVLIDTGNSLMFRAGAKHKADMPPKGTFELKHLKQVDDSVFQNMTPEQLKYAAEKLSAVPAATIKTMVDNYGPGNAEQKQKLYSTLLERRHVILDKVQEMQKAAKEAAAFTPDPPDFPPPKPIKPKIGSHELLSQLEEPAGDFALSLPSKPVMTAKSAQWINPKFDALEAAAKTGDINKVMAIKTNPGSKTLLMQKAHAYKEQLLAAMAGGSKAVPAPVGAAAKPKAPAFTPKPPKATDLPKDPEFSSKNAANVAANKQTIEEIKKHALAGDLEKLQTMPLTGSPKVQDYHSQVVATVKEKMTPPPPPPTVLEGDYAKILGQVPPKAQSHADKIGYWAVVSNLGGVPGGIKQPNLPFKKSLFDKMSDIFATMQTSWRSAIKSYTGSGYVGQNNHLRGLGGGDKEPAERSAKAIMKHGIDMPEGTTLWRKYSPTGKSDHIKRLESAVGKVIADGGILSTSSSESGWHGNVHIKLTVGPGVKGLPARSISSHKSEDEIIFAPNTRILITKVEKTPSHHERDVYVEAVILPFHPDQWP